MQISPCEKLLIGDQASFVSVKSYSSQRPALDFHHSSGSAVMMTLSVILSDCDGPWLSVEMMLQEVQSSIVI